MPAAWREKFRSVPGVTALLNLRAGFEAHWFDWRYHIHTCGDVEPQDMKAVGNNTSHALKYNPTTVRSAKMVFRELPVNDCSRFTFIDFGSGKGRMLLVASEYRFRRILGIEFASDLHAIAAENIRRYKNPRQVCFDIESLNIDATQFVFPPEDSVLYFFSPFRQPVMRAVIERLDRSLDECPRNIVLVYLNPELTEIVEGAHNLDVFARRRYHTTYVSRAAAKVEGGGSGDALIRLATALAPHAADRAESENTVKPL